jgi:protein SCO1/2
VTPRRLLSGLLAGTALAAAATPALASGDCCRPLQAPAVAAAQVDVLAPATLTDHRGRAVTLPDGRPWVLTFFYGHCPDVCPTLLYNVADVAQAMPAALRGKVAFGAVSFDPARDTVPKLAEQAENYALTGDDWYLMTGEPKTLDRVLGTFRFDFKPDRDGGYQHTTLTAVMDGEGRIVHHFYGLRPDVGRIAAAVGSLVGP